ncbi:hypothetical protein HDA40_004086 [Hamadaea flava]|uniref:DNA-binding transcriptional regulator of glucitol operon n=1 Tax=Hamadaea flava TaxID=1742688 RepID=A0ABV8LH82_9ACTN|nr:hypothetical protein [Hamadaea flava]MCP2325579.1 hypothetical protein [Hamadaea flava]
MRPLLTPRWLAGHTLAVVMVIASAGLTWWQITRAMGGNVLSYGYAFFWPAFAGFVVMIWVREMRMALGRAPAKPVEKVPTSGFGRPVITFRSSPVLPAPEGAASSQTDRAVTTRPVTDTTAEVPADEDPELAEYNRLLAWLAEHPGARPADYPGEYADQPGERPQSAQQMQETS